MSDLVIRQFFTNAEIAEIFDAVINHNPIGRLLKIIIVNAFDNIESLSLQSPPVGLVVQTDEDGLELTVTVAPRHLIELPPTTPNHHQRLHLLFTSQNVLMASVGDQTARQSFPLYVSALRGSRDTGVLPFVRRLMRLQFSPALLARDAANREALIFPTTLPPQLIFQRTNGRCGPTSDVDDSSGGYPVIWLSAHQQQCSLLSEAEVDQVGEALFSFPTNTRNESTAAAQQQLNRLLASITALPAQTAAVCRFGLLIFQGELGTDLLVRICTRDEALAEMLIDGEEDDNNSRPVHHFLLRDDFNRHHLGAEHLFLVSRRRGALDFGTVPLRSRPLRLELSVGVLLPSGVRPPHQSRPLHGLLALANGTHLYLPPNTTLEHVSDSDHFVQIHFGLQQQYQL